MLLNFIIYKLEMKYLLDMIVMRTEKDNVGKVIDIL